MNGIEKKVFFHLKAGGGPGPKTYKTLEITQPEWGRAVLQLLRRGLLEVTGWNMQPTDRAFAPDKKPITNGDNGEKRT